MFDCKLMQAEYPLSFSVSFEAFLPSRKQAPSLIATEAKSTLKMPEILSNQMKSVGLVLLTEPSDLGFWCPPTTEALPLQLVLYQTNCNFKKKNI